MKTVTQPRIAVLYSVPLLCEALSVALENIAEIQSFPANCGDMVGLLRSIDPDAVVVDSADDAAQVRGWAQRHRMPLVHVSLREQKLRVLKDGNWEESAGASAESIRNALAASIYGRDGGG